MLIVGLSQHCECQRPCSGGRITSDNCSY